MILVRRNFLLLFFCIVGKSLIGLGSVVLRIWQRFLLEFYLGRQHLGTSRASRQRFFRTVPWQFLNLWPTWAWYFSSSWWGWSLTCAASASKLSCSNFYEFHPDFFFLSTSNEIILEFILKWWRGYHRSVFFGKGMHGGLCTYGGNWGEELTSTIPFNKSLTVIDRNLSSWAPSIKCNWPDLRNLCNLI